MILKLRAFFEQYGFSVCTRIANLLGMKVSSVRLFFIYTSFITILGGPILYLLIAIFQTFKDMVYRKRPSVFDL